MARGVNKVILVGNLGKDPESRELPGGSTVVNFCIATSESWKDKNTGERTDKTEWHNIVAFGKLADIIAQYLHKGSQVYVEGSLQTRKWQDKEGNDRYTTEVKINEMQMLGGKGDVGAEYSTPAQSQAPKNAPAPKPEPAQATASLNFDDDIPF